MKIHLHITPFFSVAVATFCVPVFVCAAPAITGVTAQQRYPWNGKVDISYTVSGGIAAMAKQDAIVTNLKVTATDRIANQTYTASALSGDTVFTDGPHSIVWDMEADGLTFKSSNVIFSVSCETTPATYCVIDLSGGDNASSYPVTYLAAPPSGGLNVDTYKTTKLVLKRIEAGSYRMGGSVNVTLTKPFFIGIFEVTQKQYELVTGDNPSPNGTLGDTYPVERVSYNAIRGSSDGALWPSSSAVDSDSFMGRLRARTGLDFDLPTEAQWEYACRAGTTTTYNYGDEPNGNRMYYSSTGSNNYGSRRVGRTNWYGQTTFPNPWGLYEMHGNVWEWCLDWHASSLSGGTDPKGSSSGSERVKRGGSWFDEASSCTSSYRGKADPSYTTRNGFRLARTLNK